MEVKSGVLNRFCVQTSLPESWHCPSCSAKLTATEMAQHCEEELKRLQQQLEPRHATSTEQAEQRRNDHNDVRAEGNSERRKPWSVFQKVQRNRQSRLRRTRKRKLPSQPTEQTCPVCNVNYPADEIELHAERCLRRSNGRIGPATGGATNGRDAADSSEDDGEEYEEYEWAGQKRIRVSSMLRGGYASLGIGQTVTQHNSSRPDEDDEDEDLNVDEDDTRFYGPSQYAESDVIPPANDEANCIRRFITGSASASNEPCSSAPAAAALTADIESTTTTATTCLSETGEKTTAGIPLLTPSTDATPTAQQYQQIIESLKARLRHTENQAQNKFKCLICLDEYRKPAISVACWHVHCEECWLRSLGTRKLCPQCNLITTPKDLRRIYM